MDTVLKRKRVVLTIAIVFTVLSLSITHAQEDDRQNVELLILGVDINGQGYPLVLVNVASSRADTLATFANRPVCRPSITVDGQVVLYELHDSTGTPYVYQINIEGRERSLLGNGELALDCPLIAPSGDAIVWNQPNPDGTVSVVLTDPYLNNPVVLQVHPSILDIQWTPGGGALIYQIIAEQAIFPELVSLPRQGGVVPRVVFQTSDGILLDYIWTSDGTGLLVAYATDVEVMVALLQTSCVIGPGPRCTLAPIATFAPDTDIDLLRAYAPTARQTVLVAQTPMGDGGFSTDLWLVDLTATTEPRQLTTSVDVIESDAIWSPDETTLYFIGSRFDQSSQTLRGAIYRLDMMQPDPQPELVFESPVFSPSAFLYVYSPPPVRDNQ